MSGKWCDRRRYGEWCDRIVLAGDRVVEEVAEQAKRFLERGFEVIVVAPRHRYREYLAAVSGKTRVPEHVAATRIYTDPDKPLVHVVPTRNLTLPFHALNRHGRRTVIIVAEPELAVVDTEYTILTQVFYDMDNLKNRDIEKILVFRRNPTPWMTIENAYNLPRGILRPIARKPYHASSLESLASIMDECAAARGDDTFVVACQIGVALQYYTPGRRVIVPVMYYGSRPEEQWEDVVAVAFQGAKWLSEKLGEMYGGRVKREVSVAPGSIIEKLLVDVAENGVYLVHEDMNSETLAKTLETFQKHGGILILVSLPRGGIPYHLLESDIAVLYRDVSQVHADHTEPRRVALYAATLSDKIVMIGGDNVDTLVGSCVDRILDIPLQLTVRSMWISLSANARYKIEELYPGHVLIFDRTLVTHMLGINRRKIDDHIRRYDKAVDAINDVLGRDRRAYWLTVYTGIPVDTTVKLYNALKNGGENALADAISSLLHNGAAARETVMLDARAFTEISGIVDARLLEQRNHHRNEAVHNN